MITDLKDWKLIKESLDSDSTPLLLSIKDESPEILDGRDWYIDTIMDIVKDPKDIEKYESLINTTLGLEQQNIKQGDHIYITALLKPRNNSTVLSGGEPAIIRAKIEKIYYGLSKLGELQKKGKLI